MKLQNTKLGTVDFLGKGTANFINLLNDFPRKEIEMRIDFLDYEMLQWLLHHVVLPREKFALASVIRDILKEHSCNSFAD